MQRTADLTFSKPPFFDYAFMAELDPAELRFFSFPQMRRVSRSILL
jgi:hypothetical protein